MNDEPKQTILNLDNALSRLSGDRELLFELIDFYLEDYEKLLRKASAAAENDDPIALKRSAHSLKGLAANFDAMKVIEATNAITNLSGPHVCSMCSKELTGLAQAANELAEALRVARRGEDLNGS